MMHSSLYLRLAAAVAVFASLASGFQPDSRDNVAVYWGQNFVSGGQQRLSAYCSSTKFNIVPIAFLVSLQDPLLNLANGDDNCTALPGAPGLRCPQVAEDIETCQTRHGKTVLLSIGGATYNEGGFASAGEARAAADRVWDLFGPNTQAANRPFGRAVVDGFDFDFESPTKNMVPFARRLRELMDAAAAASAPAKKKYYLSAAPQCVYPDAADGEMLAGEVSFDFVMVQFYNNFCGVQSFVGGLAGGGSARRQPQQQPAFNFAAWDAWARGKTADGTRGSKNPDVKILLGVPASRAAASSGFLEPALLKPVVEYAATFASFGGVMMWDMSHLFSPGSGSGGGVAGSFLEDVHGALSLAANKGGNNRATKSTSTSTSSIGNGTTTGSADSSGAPTPPTISAAMGGYFPSAAVSWSGLALGIAFHSLVGSVLY